MQPLPEHEEGQPARARWVLAIPEALHAAWLPGIEEFLGENHTSPPSMLCFSTRLQLTLLRFIAAGHSCLSAMPAVPVTLFARGTLQGPGVMGALLTGEPLSGVSPARSMRLSVTSGSLPL